MRFAFPAIAIVLFLTASAPAGDDGLTGRWKLSIYEDGQQIPLWLVHLDSKDGKLTAAIDSLKSAPKAKKAEAKLVGDTVKISFRSTVTTRAGQQREIEFDYEGKLPKPGAKKILGSMNMGQAGNVTPAILEATQAKDVFGLDREILSRTPTDPKALTAILDVIDQAAEHKLAAKDLQALVDGSLRAGELYGPRLQRDHEINLLSALKAEKAYAGVAVETARTIGKSIDPKLPLDLQLQLLTKVAEVLRSGDQKKEAQVMENRIEKLENVAYAEHLKTALNYKLEKFAGRKEKSKRAVLVELFTGAACPPCVAADLAFDGLEKTYAPADVVLLQYHMHIPSPEPMSSPDSEGRFEFYAEAYPGKVRGTPVVLFNGKPDAPGGGFRDDAGEKYKEYCQVINKLLEAPATVELSATASRKDDKISIEAKVKGLAKPGEKVRLRLALTENWVRFKGSNGQPYHHCVVRAMPLGVKGVALKEKDSDQKASVDLATLRKILNKYLDDGYPEGARPMNLRHLSVVAFVQNDESLEVLQAVHIPVREE